MPKYGLNKCFSQVINPRQWADIDEHKFGRYGSAKIGSWKIEKNCGLDIPKSS